MSLLTNAPLFVCVFFYLTLGVGSEKGALFVVRADASVSTGKVTFTTAALPHTQR